MGARREIASRFPSPFSHRAFQYIAFLANHRLREEKRDGGRVRIYWASSFSKPILEMLFSIHPGTDEYQEKTRSRKAPAYWIRSCVNRRPESRIATRRSQEGGLQQGVYR